MSKVYQFLVLLAHMSLFATPSNAVDYTVSTTGGGQFTTIQACANVVTPGDSCIVSAGTYSETVKVPTSGTAQNRITFTARAGDAVVVNAFVISDRQYITIRGFEIVNATGRGIVGSGSHHAVIENNDIHTPGGECIRLGYPATANDTVIRGNKIHHCGWGNGGTGLAAVQYFGSRTLIEANDISESADGLYGGGPNTVIRGNVMHSFNAQAMGTTAHIDGIQASGVSFRYSLVEDNVFKDCVDTTRNCHFILIQDDGADSSDTIVVRHNYAQNIDGLCGGSYGNATSHVPNVRHYNNTCATVYLAAEDGHCGAMFWNAPNGVVKNNVCYSAIMGGYKPFRGEAASGGNLVYTPGYAAGWPAPYSEEDTYALLSNKDPQFANYPASPALKAGSPARQAGVPLTFVSGADSGSGTTLFVQDSRFFQPGWAGVNADWIRVGLLKEVQIIAVDYTAHKITLASPIARVAGEPIYLSRNSKGHGVLEDQALPDVGAHTGSASAPDPPSGLRIVDTP